METLIIETKTKKQSNIFKALAKELNISVEKSPYDPEFVTKIQKAKEAIKNGNGTKISKASDIWKLI